VATLLSHGYSSARVLPLTLTKANSCFDWGKTLGTLTQMQLMQQGGKPHGGKVGLGHTLYDDSALRGVTNPRISPDARVSGIRATDRMRIFGSLINHIFFVLWFDPKHEIAP